GKYFNGVRLKRLIEEAEYELDKGKPEAAHGVLLGTSKIELGEGKLVKPAEDFDVWREAYDEQRDRPLVPYPGKLSRFLNDAMVRDSLIAFMGPDKSGKCLAEDTEVILSNGSVKTIEKLVAEKSRSVRVIAMNEATNHLVASEVEGFFDNGSKECWEVETRSGRKIQATLNHPFYTVDGWTMLKDIFIGAFMRVPKRVGVFGNARVSNPKLKFLSYMLAEGCCISNQGSYNSIFTNTDSVIVSDFKNCCKELGITYTKVGKEPSYRLKGSISLLKELGLAGHTAKNKRIPDCVYTTTKDQIALFLRIFFSCDGYIYKLHGRGRFIEITLANEKMLRQISHLLLRFGIVHTFRYKQARCNGKVFDAWRIVISCSEYVNIFLREINFLSYKKTNII
ncbi:hypothetical protein LCGC14_2771300, partial [marine sediment metagenome]